MTTSHKLQSIGPRIGVSDSKPVNSLLPLLDPPWLTTAAASSKDVFASAPCASTSAEGSPTSEAAPSWAMLNGAKLCWVCCFPRLHGEEIGEDEFCL